MNAVFADIDGVLNSYIWEYDDKGELICRFRQQDKDAILSNFQSICWLNEYCRLTNTNKIVVTSTWRSLGLDAIRNILLNSGLSPDIEFIDVTEELFYNKHRRSRGYEIYTYLIKNPDISKFIILDDDCDMGSLEKYLIKCNIYTGFTMVDFMNAKKMFNELKNDDWKDSEMYYYYYEHYGLVHEEKIYMKKINNVANKDK